MLISIKENDKIVDILNIDNISRITSDSETMIRIDYIEPIGSNIDFTMYYFSSEKLRDEELKRIMNSINKLQSSVITFEGVKINSGEEIEKIMMDLEPQLYKNSPVIKTPNDTLCTANNHKCDCCGS